MSQNEQIVNEIIPLIVNAVNLHHVDPKTLNASTSLRDGGLELDSVDILEIIVAVEHRYGVKIDDAETGKKYFRTLGTIAQMIQERQPSANPALS